MMSVCVKQAIGSVLRGAGVEVWRTSRQPSFNKWWRVAAAGFSGVRSASSSSSSSSSEHIISSTVPDITLPTGNTATHVLERANQWPTKIALECAVTGRSYTYAQTVDAVARWSGFLATIGLRRGDVIAIMMLSCPEYAVVILGALSIDVTVTVINHAYTPEEVCRQLQDCGASLVVHDDATQKVVERTLSLCRKPIRRVTNTDASPPDGVPSLRSLLKDTSLPFLDPVEVSGTETAMLPYSSGTTGKPKGVSVSHNAFTSNIDIFCHPSFVTAKHATESQRDTFLCFLPMFHVYGILPITFVGLRLGAKIVMMPNFDAKTFIPHIVKHKVRLLHTVPPVLNFLAQSPDVTPESMKSLESVLCGAAPVPTPCVNLLKQKMDKPLFYQEGYGMTEVLISHTTPIGSSRLNTCGKVLPNVKCKVMDADTGKALPANEKGEICFLSPSRMTGYINNEEATRKTIDEEGWVWSGDIGYYDDDHYFTIVDRCKELIKVKAMQVAPSELEEVLLQHPKVKEVGVVGVPHDRLGEAPRAYVVPSSSVTEKEIQEFVASHVAPHKKLVGGVAFISDLPKTASGKILRRQLKTI